MSDDADVRQRAVLLEPREGHGHGLPVYAELPRSLDARGHLRPNLVLKRVERLPERGVVLGSGPAVVQHRMVVPTLLCAGHRGYIHRPETVRAPAQDVTPTARLSERIAALSTYTRSSAALLVTTLAL